MTMIVRPGKYLIEKTRRSLVGVIAKVGTGGSVPKPVQEAIDSYIDSLAAGQKGADAKMIRDTERQVIRQGMKKMQGTWMILSGSGLRWITVGFATWDKEIASMQQALRGTGWSPNKTELAQLVLGPDAGEPGVKRVKLAKTTGKPRSSDKRS